MVNNEIKRAYKRIYDEEQLEYFKSIVPGHFTNEISDLFYEKFGIRYKKQEIENIKRTYGLYSNVRNFKKGIYQGNNFERKKGEERIRYRKGIPQYIEIKINNKKYKNKENWVKKHHYIWEKYNGKIPENCFIGFKDGNILNCDIDNLILMNYTDRIIFNYNGLNMHNGEELLKVNLLISQTMQKRNKKRKEL